MVADSGEQARDVGWLPYETEEFNLSLFTVKQTLIRNGIQWNE